MVRPAAAKPRCRGVATKVVTGCCPLRGAGWAAHSSVPAKAAAAANCARDRGWSGNSAAALRRSGYLPEAAAARRSIRTARAPAPARRQRQA